MVLCYHEIALEHMVVCVTSVLQYLHFVVVLMVVAKMQPARSGCRHGDPVEVPRQRRRRGRVEEGRCRRHGYPAKALGRRR
jgi:hypothetical protein